MAFGDNIDKLINPALSSTEKARLKVALSQFSYDRKGTEIDYSNFYDNTQFSYFLQGDLIHEIRFANWVDETAEFTKNYTNAILLSNTCDVSDGNQRDLNIKECIFAPLIEFDLYQTNLLQAGYTKEKLNEFVNRVKSQTISNLLYLPKNHNDNKEYLAFLDKMFRFPVKELNSYLEQVNDNRIISLTHFGHYLFTLKLSYHLCRLPEEDDRNEEHIVKSVAV